MSVSHIDKKVLKFSRLLMKNKWIFDSVHFFLDIFSRSEIWLQNREHLPESSELLSVSVSMCLHDIVHVLCLCEGGRRKEVWSAEGMSGGWRGGAVSGKIAY